MRCARLHFTHPLLCVVSDFYFHLSGNFGTFHQSSQAPLLVLSRFRAKFKLCAIARSLSGPTSQTKEWRVLRSPGCLRRLSGPCRPQLLPATSPLLLPAFRRLRPAIRRANNSSRFVVRRFRLQGVQGQKMMGTHGSTESRFSRSTSTLLRVTPRRPLPHR